jgi:GNAT superfamily N-acetyltransferase
MRVLMVRTNLEGIPAFTFPESFSVRWYQPGDEAHWLRIDRLANPDSPLESGSFGRCFGMDPAVLAERQCYLVNAHGQMVGTATAWYDDHFQGERFGRVHYVAVVPAYQGRGLSKPLMTVVCNRLRELGHDRAYLATETHRVPAINLYLRFGFVPLIGSPEEAAAWQALTSGGAHAIPCNRAGFGVTNPPQ